MKIKDVDVLKYTVYRLIHMIPVLLMVSIIVFAFLHALPGDVIDALLDDESVEDPLIRPHWKRNWGWTNPSTYNTPCGCGESSGMGTSGSQF